LRAEAAKAVGVPVSRREPGRPLTAAGLDSLGAVELRARAESALGLSLPLSDLLEGATLAELAAGALEALESGAPAAVAGEPSAAGEETGDFPLSHGQRSLWFLHRLAPESLAYHLAGAARVQGPLDPGALAWALEALVERHPALRTTFHEGASGEPFQRVHPELAPEILIEDAEGWSGEEGEARLRSEVWRPFDLTRGPLVRLGVLRCGGGESVLFLAIHHIVSDFWSLAVMARDLGALYTRETGRPAPVPPPLELRYTDWSRWRQERLAGPEGERLWEHWRRVLAGDPPRLELPTDRPWPAALTWAAGNRNFRLDGALTGDLQALARRRGGTLFMGLLAVFEALLARYTGQEEILLGTPTTGRAPAVADLVGYFVNPVAVRTRLADDPSFLAVLDETRRAVVAAFEHQDHPFSLLAERLQPRRDPARPPLFDVLFAFEKARGTDAELGGFALGEAGARLRLGGLELESVALPPAGAPFALSFVLAETEGETGASLRFNAGLFDAATMDRLAGHYRTLLAGALAEPGLRLSELPLLTPEEEWQLLAEWNETAAGYSRDSAVHRLVGVWAATAPDAPAVDGLSYGELVDRAGRVAGWLRRQGVGPEVRVPVVLDRSPELVVAVLAVLKAGGAYVPLDPAHPAERLAWQLEDAWAGSPVRVLLTRSELAGSLRAADARVLRVDADLERLAPWQEAPAPLPAGRAAYVIYTSGSTGRPKGVVVSHGALANLVEWHCRTYGVEPADRAALVAGPGFDASVWEIWPYLAAGASLRVPAEEVRSSPARMVGWLAEEGITIAFLPTPLAEAALAEPWPEKSRLRALLTGGDRLHRGPRPGLPFTLHNHYGPTEGAVVATCAPAAPERVAPPIGRPIANARVYVADRWSRLAPAGVPGELLLGGDGLARGYLHRPDLTAAAFVPDAFGDEAGCRLYRTGDLVRWTPEGHLEFLGRADRQVKVRGFRIEPGEIEAVLTGLPGVREAVVDVQGDRLVAWVAGAATSAELREGLRGRLPEAMIPAAWVFLDALPLTPNGKVDRRALPAPEIASEAGRIAPRTPVEERLAGIWSELLGVGEVGAGDDFFALGGHSLLAARAATRVGAAFGIELPVSLVFEAPTLARLAAEIEARLATGTAEPPLRRATPEEREAGLPLSYAQERLWFLDRLEPGSAAYNIAGGLRLQGELDVPALARALAGVVRRHEALRTRFEDGPVQRVLPAPAPDLPVLEVPEGEVERRALEEAAKPFDLTQGPLFRATLLRVGEEEHVLLAAMHHIASDGLSMEVFLREVAALYGGHTPLPEPPVQYGDYALWERGWLAGEVLEARLAEAKSRLAGAPTFLELPTDQPRPAALSSRGGREALALPSGVEALAREAGATPFMVLLSALEALLARYTGREDLLVGSPVANRGRLEAEGLIGCFVNTIVLRGGLAGDPPFREILARTRTEALAAFAHQELPFEKLVEALVTDRSRSRTPLVQVVLALQPALPAPGLPGLEARRLDLHNGTAKFELTAELVQGAAGFAGGIEYNADLFEAATVRRLGEHLGNLLAGALAHPELRLSELPLLGKAETAQVLAGLNPPAADWPEGDLLHEMVLAQVERTPDAVALIHGEERWTYRQLAERSGQLARGLRVAP
ncbi:MAG TPA: amino acid adenylation domain-containing protein, partial [Thermoanaerobaculia bacterium]|nr:amino acid adenylation domain-containing protein [Thermoanaerobaculia bacterium]